MPFIAQVGHEHGYLSELISNGDLEGVVLQVSHAGANVVGLAQSGGMVFVDPQTYKLADANVPLTRGLLAQPFVDAWPGAPALRDTTRRVEFVEQVLATQARRGATELISPYLFVEDSSGPAMEATLQMAEDARGLAEPGRRVWTGMFLSGRELKRPNGLDSFLNLVTSTSSDHCYLIVDPMDASSAPLSDAELVAALQRAVRVLESNEIRVLLAYSDPVGLLLMADGLSAFASGVWASLRRLRIEAERRRGQGGPRRAHQRYYLPQLMNFLRVGTELAPVLACLAPLESDVVCRCGYCARNLTDFATTGQYEDASGRRHYLASLTRDARSLSDLTEDDRRAQLTKRIDRALSLYEALHEDQVALGPDSRGQHLEAWRALL